MKNTLILVLLALSAPLAAASYTPSVDVVTKAVFSRNLSIEKEVLDNRTLFALSIDASPLSVTFARRHTLTLGVRASFVSDSLEYCNTVLLGSRRLALQLGFEERIGAFLIALDASLGYALVNRQDLGYSFIEAGLEAGFSITDYLALLARTAFVYRREFAEIQAGLVFHLNLPSGILGGER